MTRPGDTLATFIDGLEEGGDRPALLHLHEDDVEEVTHAGLGERVAAAAVGVAGQGVGRGESVALLGRASAEWIVACLSVIRAGAVAVPLDTQIEEEGLERILEDCEARWILADRASAERLGRVDHDCRVVLLEAGRPEAGDAQPADAAGGSSDRDSSDGDSDTETDEECPDRHATWAAWTAELRGELRVIEGDDRALLLYTSGTTGPRKGVPLRHRHLAFQIDVARETDLVRGDDRVLLPLPLHHVYPLVIGVFAPLALGLTVIVPQSLTGPEILRALDEGGATAVIGVPRIYRALYDGIERELDGAGRLARGVARACMATCTWTKRRLRLDLGRVLLRPVRRRIGPRLRLLLSGGAALDPDLAWRLEGLGWQVASGYGLTETAPLLAINRPESRRLESAGKPVRDVEIRIDREAAPEGEQEGEILARGPGVFDGYLNLEEETREAFTGDGWFRTGDLGWIDADGYLHVSGRKTTRIVTPAGENIHTERVEEEYAEHELIEEIGILPGEEGLAAVVVPAVAEIRRRDLDVDEAIREALDARAESMPSYQRIASFVWIDSALERTRLGKLRRHRLRERHDELREGGEAEEGRLDPIPVEEMSPADQELLADEAARQSWGLLAERFPGRGLTPDTHLEQELGVDSLGWLDLGAAIARRTGIELDEERIADIDTVRDLLEAVAGGSPVEDVVAKAPLEDPEGAIDERQERWLEPLPGWAALLARGLFGLNRAVVRLLYRLEVRGVERLPEEGPMVIAPNHASYLDPFVVAAALPAELRERTFWGGWTGVAFQNPLVRTVSRLARAVPVDPERAAASSLAFAALALERGGNLVWFPEGRRSPTGELREFRPGIGMLLEAYDDVPAVPVHIAGTHAAWPPQSRFPRPGRVRVTFGSARQPADLAELGEGEETRARIASGLHARVRELAQRRS